MANRKHSNKILILLSVLMIVLPLVWLIINANPRSTMDYVDDFPVGSFEIQAFLEQHNGG